MIYPTGRRRHNGRPSVIGSLAASDPEKASAEILEAADRARGRLVAAAAELAVTRRHLQRLLWALDLWPAVDAIRDRWARGDVDTPVSRALGRESTRVDSPAGHNPS